MPVPAEGADLAKGRELVVSIYCQGHCHYSSTLFRAQVPQSSPSYPQDIQQGHCLSLEGSLASRSAYDPATRSSSRIPSAACTARHSASATATVRFSTSVSSSRNEPRPATSSRWT